MRQVPDDFAPPGRGPDASRLDVAAGARVLVVGDCMLDRYVSGEVERISPEAPVPVLRVRDERQAPGGAANVAAGVAALGGKPWLAAAVGEDREAARLRELLEAAGIETEGLESDPDRPTTTKTRVLARHQQMIRVDRETRRPLPDAVGTRLEEKARAALDWAESLLLVDYDKGVLDEGLGSRLLQAASERGVRSVVDPKLRSFFDYRKAFVFKPNAGELAAALGAERAPEDAGSLEEVRARLAAEHLLVTLGERGMRLVGRGGERVRFDARAREVYDVSGAGDTVTAVLGVTLAREDDVPGAAALANFAAGLQVTRLGAVPVGRAEIRDALRDRLGRADARESGVGAPGARAAGQEGDQEEASPRRPRGRGRTGGTDPGP